MTMNLDHDELHRLLATLAESDIQEFRLEGEDFRLEVKRNLSGSISGPSLESLSSSEVAPLQQQSQLKVESISAAPSDPPPAVASSRSEFVEIATDER